MKNNLDYYLTQDHAARGQTMAYAIVLPVRRYLLRAAFLSIGIFILAILRIPRIEAAAADRRLREMTSEDPLPFEKVDALINFAIQNRIPIRSDSITAAQVKVLAA